MLDIKFVVDNKEFVKEQLSHRGGEYPVDKAVDLELKRRAILGEVETLKARRNSDSEKIAKLKKAKEDASSLIAEMQKLGEQIKAYDVRLSEIETELRATMLSIPNIPHKSLPVGPDESANQVVRKHGEPRKFDFEPKAHWELGEKLQIFDWPRAGKITGTRFTVYRGLGARLERAVISFMLDTHIFENNYFEIYPPYMVNRASMTGTGQLPKFEEDAFAVRQRAEMAV